MIRHTFHRQNDQFPVLKIFSGVRFQKSFHSSLDYGMSVFGNQYQMVLQQETAMIILIVSVRTFVHTFPLSQLQLIVIYDIIIT